MMNHWQLIGSKKRIVTVFHSVQNSSKLGATRFVKVSGHKTKQKGVNVGEESVEKVVGKSGRGRKEVSKSEY